MWPALAVSLTGRRDAAAILARLAYANTFVTPNAEDGGYDFHPLIRELLRAQLREESPRKIRLLHRRAAHWLADAGRLADATEHAVHAGDWEYAAWLVIEDLSIGRLLVGPEAARFADRFAGMPSRTAGPEAAVIQSAAALARLDADACAKHLLRARELVADGPADHLRALQLAIAVTEAVSAGIRGDVGGALVAIPVAEALLSEASADGTNVPTALRTLIPLTKGRVLLAAGDLTQAGSVLAEGLRASDGPDGAYLRVACLGQQALVEAHRGHLRKATGFARRAHATADRVDWPSRIARRQSTWLSPGFTLRNMTSRRHACTANGRLPPAESATIRCQPASLALTRARLRRAHGDFAGAVAVADGARANPKTVPIWLLGRLEASAAVWRAASGAPAVVPASKAVADGPQVPQSSLALASIELAGGDAAGAAATAAAVLRQERLPLDARVEGWLLAATCELTEGRTGPARKALDHSLRLAAAEQLRRPVIEAPPRLRHFLRQDRNLVAQHAWLGATVIGISDPRIIGASATEPASPIVDLLTDKEMEVLRLLAALCSTEEVARTMFVSVNTVKTHVRGILRKLGASRRNEAIRRARELGLI